MGLIILLSRACDSIDANIGNLGKCIIESWFYNSPELMGLLFYIAAGIIIYKKQMPLPIILATFMLLNFALAIFTNALLFYIMFGLGVIIIMGAMAIAIVHRFWK